MISPKRIEITNEMLSKPQKDISDLLITGNVEKPPLPGMEGRPWEPDVLKMEREAPEVKRWKIEDEKDIEKSKVWENRPAEDVTDRDGTTHPMPRPDSDFEENRPKETSKYHSKDVSRTYKPDESWKDKDSRATEVEKQDLKKDEDDSRFRTHNSPYENVNAPTGSKRWDYLSRKKQQAAINEAGRKEDSREKFLSKHPEMRPENIGKQLPEEKVGVPDALAASIGRKKYGKEKMGKLAASGKKMEKSDKFGVPGENENPAEFYAKHPHGKSTSEDKVQHKLANTEMKKEVKKPFSTKDAVLHPEKLSSEQKKKFNALKGVMYPKRLPQPLRKALGQAVDLIAKELEEEIRKTSGEYDSRLEETRLANEPRPKNERLDPRSKNDFRMVIPGKGPINPSKEKAALKVRKAIILTKAEMGESFEPVSDLELVKAFGTWDLIPDLFKSNRMPLDLFLHSLDRASLFEEKPLEFIGKMWYGETEFAKSMIKEEKCQKCGNLIKECKCSKEVKKEEVLEKAVAETDSIKQAKRTPEFDAGGQSEVSSAPENSNVKDLADKSETLTQQGADVIAKKK